MPLQCECSGHPLDLCRSTRCSQFHFGQHFVYRLQQHCTERGWQPDLGGSRKLRRRRDHQCQQVWRSGWNRNVSRSEHLNPAGKSRPTTTLTLNTPSSYFGLWWSAGDATNRLQFFNGSDLVADFTTATLLTVLPDTYRGMPSGAFAGQNIGEKYAFFNVYGDPGTT